MENELNDANEAVGRMVAVATVTTIIGGALFLGRNRIADYLVQRDLRKAQEELLSEQEN